MIKYLVPTATGYVEFSTLVLAQAFATANSISFALIQTVNETVDTTPQTPIREYEGNVAVTGNISCGQDPSIAEHVVRLGYYQQTFNGLVLASTLTGMTGSPTGQLNVADSVLTAFAKAQGQINTKQAVLPTGTTGQYLDGSLNLQSFNTSVVSSVLTGLTGSPTGQIGTTDSVLNAFAKAQGQINYENNLIRLYDGTASYKADQLLEYTNRLTTDSNGRITVNLTTNGLATGGTALFSAVLSAVATGISTSTSDPLVAPNFFMESQSATQIVFRCVIANSQSILIGGTTVPMKYGGSGITANIYVKGLR